MTPPPVVVVGRGSIGTRHQQVLTELGRDVVMVSRRAGPDCLPDLATALTRHQPDYVVIATETSEHARGLERLAAQDFRGRVLVEKPLFATPTPLPAHHFSALAVGYNLRFHPLLQRLAELLASERLISAQFYVGQYLPEWRPGRDYRTLYSSRAAEGGGALRDLSHELDCANWLLGPWQNLTARGGQWSDLALDSDDLFVILGAFERCPAATIQVNYLDRQTRRELVINSAAHTFSADLITGTLRRDRAPPELFPLERNQMYRALHQAVLTDGPGPCSAAAAQRVVAMIAAAEHAARNDIWISSEK